jgi:hypothetical protein
MESPGQGKPFIVRCISAARPRDPLRGKRRPIGELSLNEAPFLFRIDIDDDDVVLSAFTHRRGDVPAVGSPAGILVAQVIVEKSLLDEPVGRYEPEPVEISLARGAARNRRTRP